MFLARAYLAVEIGIGVAVLLPMNAMPRLRRVAGETWPYQRGVKATLGRPDLRQMAAHCVPGTSTSRPYTSPPRTLAAACHRAALREGLMHEFAKVHASHVEVNDRSRAHMSG